MRSPCSPTGVGDVPVAGGDLRQEGENGVTEIARARDQIPRLSGRQSVRLRIIELAARNGRDERLEVCGVHLVVRGHHADDVDTVRERALVAGDDRSTDAAVAVVRHDLDAGVALAMRALDRRVARAVVDDVDRGRRRRECRRASRDQLFLVVRGHDDRDALAVDHRYWRAAALPAGGDAVPHQRHDRADHEPDQRRDDDRVAAAARRDALRARR